MRPRLSPLAGLLGLLLTQLTAAEVPDRLEADIVVYGLTSAGVVAGVQATAMGRSVVLVGPDRHLGGLSASGLGWTDSGRKAVIGGLSREFYQRIKRHYDQPDKFEEMEKRRRQYLENLDFAENEGDVE